VADDEVPAVLQLEEGKVRRAPMRDNGGAGEAHREDESAAELRPNPVGSR
jgi:hypothetical protein